MVFGLDIEYVKRNSILKLNQDTNSTMNDFKIQTIQEIKYCTGLNLVYYSYIVLHLEPYSIQY